MIYKRKGVRYERQGISKATYFGKRGIFDPIGARYDLAVVGKALVTPCQNLLAGIGVGGVATDTEANGRETRVGKSRERHC